MRLNDTDYAQQRKYCIVTISCFSIPFQERPRIPNNLLLELNEENKALTCEVVNNGM